MEEILFSFIAGLLILTIWDQIPFLFAAPLDQRQSHSFPLSRRSWEMEGAKIFDVEDLLLLFFSNLLGWIFAQCSILVWASHC